MGTLADKIQAIVNSKSAIKQALINKGRTPTDVLSSYASEIEAINTGVTDLCGTISFIGTYSLAPYNDRTGARMGFNANGDVFITLKAGTSSSYENILFNLSSAPVGIGILTLQTFSHSSNPTSTYYTCVLTGVTQKINISVNMNNADAMYDYVRANITVTYA